MAIDPYVYPGTNVLRNLAETTDLARLQRFEAVSTADRISELRFKPISGAFDALHLQRIHRHIFQDVYSWAGQLRTIDLRKEGEFWFCRPEFIQQSLVSLFYQLSAEDKLTGTTPDEFGSRGGYYMGELNAVHPFREGNGRTQREFIRELGLQARLYVDWSTVTKHEMFSVSVASFQQRDHRPLGELISRITKPLGEQ